MRGKNPSAGLLAIAVFLATAFWTLALSGSLPTPNKAHPQQAQHDSQPKPSEPGGDDRLADYTWWLTLFTGLLAAVSGVQGWLLIRADKAAAVAANRNRETTARSMELREKQFAAAAEANKISATGQRAWIKIESAKLISPIVIPNLEAATDPGSDEARTVRLIIQVALRNTGHGAASQLKVSCRLEGIPEELFPFVPDQLREFGKRIRAVRSEGGSVLLPGDPEIRTFEYSGPMPHYFFQDAQFPHLIVGLEVCAAYRISTDTDIHQTQFAYREPVAIPSLSPTSEINLTRDGNREGAPT